MPPKKEPKVTIPEGGDVATGKSYFRAAVQLPATRLKPGDDKTACGPFPGRHPWQKSAGATAFPYSPAMKKSGISWTDKHLFAFIKAPAKYVPGTRMAFAGIGGDKDRADLDCLLCQPCNLTNY
jgi:cytochrome c